jgi:hypothetical protein
MKRRVETWSVLKLSQERDKVSFPEYQRQPNLWSVEKKALLIDSILQDIDIPKLYFNKVENGGFEVVDGQQRLWAIWGFVDDEFAVARSTKKFLFSELTEIEKKHIGAYDLQVTVLDDAPDRYLRELFIRLQLGLLLITGEKLHASTGAMKDLTFQKMTKQRWIKDLGVPSRRYGKETLCAQMAINIWSRSKTGDFARTRYEDLQYFFQEYAAPVGKDKEFFGECEMRISELLEVLGALFHEKAGQLRNRSYVLSLLLVADQLKRDGRFGEKEGRRFVQFASHFWKRLKEEIDAGLRRKNSLLFAFESQISSAPGEKYQIERRHKALLESFEHFQKHQVLPGDKD